MLAAVDIEGGLSSAWESIVVFAPKFVGFLAILIIGYFVAKLVAGLIDKLLARVGFDRWVERGALKEPLQKSSLEASDVMGKIAFWALFLIALQLAFGVFGPNPVSNLLGGFIAYLPKVFVAVLIVVIAAAVAKVVTELLAVALGGVSRGQWIARGAGIAILVVGVFAALNQLEIAPEIVNGLFYATLAIIVGSAIVAVGGGIQTMRGYWERASRRVEDKGREVKQNSDPEAARAQADEMAMRADPNGEHTIDLRDQAETRPY